MNELVGQRLGDYRLASLASRGAYVDTYPGTHVRTGAAAAVKVFHTPLTGARIELFGREARRLIALSHPGLVRVFDGDISGGLAFLALDAFPTSLRQVHPPGTQVPVEHVISYVQRIGDALQYAHDRELVHADLRPEHLLCRHEQALPSLRDMGMAGLLSALVDALPAPTPGSYTAPEQIRGDPQAASDQYALAALAYEWLTGIPLLASVASAQDRRLLALVLAEHAPTRSEDGIRALTTALDHGPQGRFPTVQAFVSALAQASGSVVATRQLASAQETTAVVLAPSTLPPAAQPVTQALPPAALPPVFPPFAGNNPQPPRRNVTRRQTLAGLVTGISGLAAIGVADVLTYSQLSASIHSAPVAPALVSTHMTANKEAEIAGLLWASDSMHLATLPRFAGAIEAWNATTGRQNVSLPLTVLERAIVQWAPQGKLQLLLPAKDKTLTIVDVASGQKVSSYQGYTQLDVFFLRAAHWSPDGGRVGSIGKDTFVDIWDPTSGQNMISLGVAEVGPVDLGGDVFSDEMQHNLELIDFSWSPDGGRILTWSSSGLGSVWDVRTGQLLTRYARHWQTDANASNRYTVALGEATWAPNGLFVASSVGSNQESAIDIWSTLDGVRLSSYTGHQGQRVDQLVWAPDSSLIASAGSDGLVHVWNPATGAKLFIHSDQAGTGLAWLPGGGRLASSGEQSDQTTIFQVWDALDGGHTVSYALEATNASSPGVTQLLAWSPDGKLIASVSEDGSTRIWRGGR